MKKTLIINCHPNKESYNFAIVDAYKKGAKNSSDVIEEIVIADLKFNPILEFGYQKRTELEPDLLLAWDKIKKAEHIVIVMPIWWGGIPGIAKCFFDRLFLPGMAFQYRENSPWWDKLLKGKTAHIIATMDTPTWYYRLVYSNAGIKQLKNNILEFCGIKVIKTTTISPIKNSTIEFRERWLNKIEQLAKT
jgi:NAD(P)H dehydrogenase (quinone)